MCLGSRKEDFNHSGSIGFDGGRRGSGVQYLSSGSHGVATVLAWGMCLSTSEFCWWLDLAVSWTRGPRSSGTGRGRGECKGGYGKQVVAETA
jgi:hypothetical protein